MTYNDTIRFLYGLHRHGIKLGLEPTARAHAALGAPSRSYHALHIGGTNGKGSTAAMLAAVLQQAGYRVGLYTSPHLVTFRERIRVNGTMISESSVTTLTAKIREAVAEALTFFELTTVMALQHFRDASVDIAVLEVGMGGRFDATNIVSPLGVIITNVAKDHEAYLGSELSHIAFEKAGIIKTPAPVVVGAVDADSERVIRDRAREMNAPCVQYHKDFEVERELPSAFRYRGPALSLEHLTCALPGDHQLTNAACALALLESLPAQYVRIPESAIRRGLTEVQWSGRFHTLAERPRVIVDGAHNPAAAAALRSALDEMMAHLPGSALILIVGMMRDKDHAAFLKPLAEAAVHVVLTVVASERSATADALAEALPSGTCRSHKTPNLEQAVALARESASPGDIICVTGSLFLVGEMFVLCDRDVASGVSEA